jgi:hypothetical protein
MIDTHRMHRLACAALLCALAQGCIIIDDTEENGGSASCPTREDGACFAITAACPPDAVTYSVIIHPVGGAETLFNPDLDVFECGAGASEVVDPGTYDVRVEATTAEEDVVFTSEAEMGQEVADLDDVSLDFDFPEGQGFFWVDWAITMDGSDATCEDVGATDIEIQEDLTADGTSTTDVIPCVNAGWQTRALDFGAYDVTVRLLDDTGTPLEGAEAPLSGELSVDSELVELSAVTFEFTSAVL